ncbi:conserved Plasmodium protein, unknown function [Plasmodium sp. gorilla clade G2]|uniref:conserved Plasmodium protein, unknown function n=1 Tax=Plasmodium sp. gorilla clade G2 TaxID=880535 RepID=UPI000D221ABD|nr:conserved Plasmodium protein, unknown function [Plasmodium sp. gorilla clade G2]SOV11785.1 conserved Plasmodium protein, unknown function [Plasmodium sp. gorilla clade G2]
MKEQNELEKEEEGKNKNSFSNVNIKFEAYGEGDYRLLRYLPDGSCVFEEIPNEEDKNQKNLQQYAQLFYSVMDKMNESKLIDENLKNNKEWNKAEEYRNLVENDLKELMVLFDMLLGTLNYDKGRKFLSFNKCQYNKDSEENKQDLYIAVTSRKELLENLKDLCEKTKIQIDSINGIIGQKYYLFFINQLIKHWKILNKKYSEMDYMQFDNNFPYVTQLSVEFFFLPSIFWKFSSNPIFLSWPPFPSFSPFKSQYAHITFSLNYLEEKADMQNIIKNLSKKKENDMSEMDCDKELDNSSVKENSAQSDIIHENIEQKSSFPMDLIDNNFDQNDYQKGNSTNDSKHVDDLEKQMYTNNNEKNYKIYYPNIKEDEIKIFNLLDNTSNIKVQFDGIASHFIENNYLLQLDLFPLNVKLNSKRQDSQNVLQGEKKKMENMFPHIVIPKNIIFDQAKKVHEKLSKAQWVLIDKSIFSILAEQANNLKDTNNDLTINLDNIPDVHTKIKIHCTQINHQSIEFLIHDIKILSLSNKYIPVDFSFVISYESIDIPHFKDDKSSINEEENTPSRHNNDTDSQYSYNTSKMSNSQKVNNSENIKGSEEINNNHDPITKKNNTSDDILDEKDEALSIDSELIQIFLNLSLSKIRDLFICSWKYFSFELPYYSADIHPLIYQNNFSDYRSDTLITNFFSWFLSSMIKYLRVKEKLIAP